MELKLLDMDEEGEKKNKSLPLKAKYSESNGDMALMARNIKKFLKHEKQQQEGQNKNEGKYSFTLTCYQCGKKGISDQTSLKVKRKIKIRRNLRNHGKWQESLDHLL